MAPHRYVIATVTVAAALALAGCSSGGGGTATPTGAACDELANEVGNISNGAQNTLAASELSEDAPAYFSDLEDRVDALEEQWDDDEAVSGALDGFSDAIEAGADYVDAPSDTADPAAISADIAAQEVAVKESCTT